MDAGADSGDILSQREVVIDDNDDARSLYNKVTETALEQIEEFLPQLKAEKFQRKKQDQQATNVWRKRGSADGKIDWRMSALSIHNLVRGLTKPYVGAHFIINGQEVKVWKTLVINNVPKNIEPGKVIIPIGSKPFIKCGEDAIELLITEPPIELTEGSYL